ncbi:hypothetical protein E4U09_005762 [Claviceps aff. purpurea]|uniref:Transcriptional coactivator HFI1/ADA1 n=1 Tax=Claviceps aff. purpurea TaxID=1967640 RepID=A0A9P7QRA3_9HYPO|nr:hypothetical protein E4U09_005762 [Claviceps aff. purpurea]
MPDIDPAALSRPTVTQSTPTLSNKTLFTPAPGSAKPVKTSQIIPARIDLEPVYSTLKSAIGGERWPFYKESTAEFLIGRLSQAEYIDRIDAILADHNGEKEHLHNQLLAAILGNVTREMPDQGPAPWVSANDKPAATPGSKPVTGDATERKLKGEVMQLPPRDRRRIKDILHNDYDHLESLSNIFTEVHRKPSTTIDMNPNTAAGIHNMNIDVEVRKRFAQPLAVESGEFPDVGVISGRMLPFCYETGLSSGHAADAPQLVTVATEIFIKEVLTQIVSRTRSNGPGDSAFAGYGVGTTWVQTHKYKKQLHLEEEASMRGEVTRDKLGLLPVEAKAASERNPIGIADLRIALELADTGMSLFPILMTQVLYGYREGELEGWQDYTYVNNQRPVAEEQPDAFATAQTNGYPEAMDIDEDMFWEGAESQDMDILDMALDSCMMVGS